ncbi:endonuclease/exonuclease/phosphatase family protein [Vibrio rarus]|uniref:endonuclease/exonuclease/phosphatase family protein n=1 Tax=Vibrio rarus TaxID=413403 RepID=UPI0021C3517A|nr:endonuclease/exonuclease/phosphatase family protein [Vibrio rarus]
MKLAETSNLSYLGHEHIAVDRDVTLLLAHQFKISTFNLFNYLAPPGAYYEFENIYTRQQWQDKQQWLSRQIERSDADIIGFQEIFSPDELQQQLKTLGYNYFACVDTPVIKDDFIHSEPVVGIASRYPLLSVTAVQGESQAVNELDFAFSRTPIHAVVELPYLGKIDVVVVHFKSQRPMELSQRSDTLMSVERWRSTMQRGLEARFVSAFLAQRKSQLGYPQLLVGDFNRTLHSAEFCCFIEEAQGVPSPLQDAKTLMVEATPFIATHYYGAKGSVLDYVLLSEEFDRNSAACLYEVSDYQVADAHLVNPIYAIDRMASDHGLVTVTLRARDLSLNDDLP